ncbi:dipeptide ABC transporter ATP-binding protein [Methylovirgula sp. 4M-Z18]|uniref:dipeptide ABC transporter ATP-binding protein n=1 Tax=Methylovirgula sp. 4M-Z18 TaxID=2293567 RepID=UPI000E2E9347|nr:ABC transporter ATP-binding protein [Methylovirgula sp. 4M-Z18]RFB79099.1 ABC transporter ATP-binding protein [Methylovirgula sp. 4M-Z18]
MSNNATTPRPPLLEVSDLAVSYRSDENDTQVVRGVSFAIQPGEIVALVGESGSGKTTTAQAIIGLLPSNGRLDRGTIRLNGNDISRLPQRELNAIRGARISLIPQDPASSLNPVVPIGKQIAEIMQIHERARSAVVEAQVVKLLARVGLSQPELRAKQFPHELSGGMRQRVLIAIAIAMRPALIIADEPTSALDVTVQKRILDLIDDLRRAYGTAVLLVTHDLGVAADRADRLIVLQNGEIREQGATGAIIAAPYSAYTEQLLADAPSLARAVNRPPRPPVSQTAGNAIIVEHLVQDFVVERRRAFRAVDDVSLTVRSGTTHAIVGESGSGKTTIARNVVGLLKPTAGRILVDGTDWTSLRGEALRQFRRKIQLVYQNPYNSLDPRQTIFQIIEEPLLNFALGDKAERERKVAGLIERVGLPSSLHNRTPLALSGGQRQRVAIARALVLEPQILVLDEAVSALDVTVQAQILTLLDELQRALGLTYLFVSHDLAVVRQIADTVSVLHNGRVMESGKVEDVFAHPASPYTRTLLEAIPGQSFRAPAAPGEGPSLMAFEHGSTAKAYTL